MTLQGFDKTYYLDAKLAALQAKFPDEWSDKTAEDLEAYFADAGLTAEDHYNMYGWKEDLDPNAYFNGEEYKLAKAKALFDAGGYDTMRDALTAFENAWGDQDPYQHYLQYGAEEGLNPSNDFYASGYLADKLAALQANPDTADAWADKTVDDLEAAFDAAGLNALTHFILYGEDEGLIAPEVPDDKKVDPLPVPGETFTLTTDTDIIEGTADDDTIDGVSSSLSSEKTLNPADQIDGADGNDTLNVTVKGSFGGFSGDGFLKNVETVNLTSDSNIARDFDATGVTGVEKYVIDATTSAVNLKDLGDLGATIAVSNQAKGAFSVAYATDVTKGTSDSQALIFENVGTINDPDTAANEEQVVTTTIAGVEELTLDVSGDNVANFTAANTKTMTVTGDGSLKMATGPAALKTLDASAATGNLNINLTASTDATTASLGSGDDTLTVGVGDVTKNAELSGGDGADTLVLAATGTVQYVMSGFETVNLANAAALTFSAANTSDLETIQASKAMTAAATFATLGSADYTVDLLGANASATTLTMDNSGATTLNVSSPASTATAAAPDANTVNVTLTDSASLNMVVDEKMDYQGKVVATKATSVELDIQGQTSTATAEIEADAATGVVISAVENDSVLALDADAATDLNVTAEKDLDLKAGTSLTALESLTVNTDGDFDLSGVALAKIASVTLEGAGSVDLGALGAATQDGYAITVTATGLSGDETAALKSLEIFSIDTKGQNITVDASGVLGEVQLGTINADNAATTAGDVVVDLDGVGDNFSLGIISGNNVTVDAGGALGTASYNTINVADTLTLVGAELAANDWTAVGTVTVTPTGDSLTADVTGGIDNDTLTIVSADVNDTADITVSGDLGIGTNKVTIDASAELDAAVTIDASGLTNVTTANLLGGAEADTIKGTDGNDSIVTYGESDTLTGGDGTDTFAINTDLGTEGVTITDFETASDAITIAAVSGIAATGSALITALSGTKAFGTRTSTGAFAGTISAATLGAAGMSAFVISGADLTAAISGFTVASVGNDFRLLFLDTDGADQGLYIVAGTGAATAVVAGDVTATVDVVLTGSNDIVASDITFI